MTDMANAPQTTDARIEPQSGAERRMNIRSFDYWESLLDGRDFPSVGDLDPDQIAPFRDYSLLIDFTAGYEAPILRYVGAHLRTEAGLANREIDPNDVPPGTLLSRLTNHYLEILANRAPIGFEAEYFASTGERVLYRGILLPLSDDGTTINFIYGVLNWRVEERPEVSAADFGQEPDILDLDSEVSNDDPEYMALSDALSAAEQAFDRENSARDDADGEDAGAEGVDETTDLALQSLVTEIDAALGLEGQGAQASADVDHDVSDLKKGSVEERDLEIDALLGEDLADSQELLNPDMQDPEIQNPELMQALASAGQELVDTVPQGDDDEELFDLLSQCQDKAADLARFDSRSRQALYDTLALAYDFHLVSMRRVEAYQALLDQTSIKIQKRAPLTPIVKLVFGAGYDKTRLTEYAAALAYADREGVAQGGFIAFVEDFEGGIKAMVMAERAARSTGKSNARGDAIEAARAQLRKAKPALAIPAAQLPSGIPSDGEFVMMIARKNGSGGVDVLDTVKTGQASLDKAVKSVASATKKA